MDTHVDPSQQQRPIAALSFTGGKDSMLALHLVTGYATLPPSDATTSTDHQLLDVKLLVVFAPENPTFKAHPLPVMQAQAQALGLPLQVCTVRAPHLESYQAAMSGLHQQHGVTHLVTGDILDVCNDFMSRATHGTGVTLHRPLWQQPRQLLLDTLWAASIQPVISCINLTKFGQAALSNSNSRGPVGVQQQSDAAGLSGSAAGEARAAGQPLAAVGAAGAAGSTNEWSGAAYGQQGQQSLTGQQQQQQQRPHGDMSQVQQQQHQDKAGASQAQQQQQQQVSDGPETTVDAVADILGAVWGPELVGPSGALGRAHAQLGVDLCGEFGEMHSCVVACPLFKGRQLVMVGVEKQVEGDFAWLKVERVELQ